MQQRPIVECVYGWGRMFRLYPDYLEVGGIIYVLSDLVEARPLYCRFLGITSIRLELRFAQKRLLLRGIANLEDAQKVTGYLRNYSKGSATGALRLGRISSYHPAVQKDTRDSDTPQVSGGLPVQRQGATGSMAISPLVMQPAGNYGAVNTGYDQRVVEASRALTAPVEVPGKQYTRKEQRERRQKRIMAERSRREHGFDVERLAELLQDEILPRVSVPIRLLPGECAHYCTDATRCREPLRTAKHYTYIARDHGILILTNERMIYIGRRSQIVLSYARLMHVSRLKDAIAFMADHWSRREIFEVARPLECTMYLECILRRFQERSAPLSTDPQEKQALYCSYENVLSQYQL